MNFTFEGVSVKSQIMVRLSKNLIPVFLFYLCSCQSSFREPYNFEDDLRYFPLNLNEERIYTVEETLYAQESGQTIMSTFQYELKEEFTSVFQEQDQAPVYTIERSFRESEQMEWNTEAAWSARVNSERIVITEGSVPFVKISFPIRVGKKWDGNAFNHLEKDEYEITAVSENFEVAGGQQFEDCVVVTQNNNEDFIVMLDKRIEVYARDIGLVYKESSILEYCTAPACLGLQQVRQGRMFKMTLKN